MNYVLVPLLQTYELCVSGNNVGINRTYKFNYLYRGVGVVDLCL